MLQVRTLYGSEPCSSGLTSSRTCTGELIVGRCKALLMDEISTGLDSSTTYQIVRCMRNVAHLQDVSC